MIGLLRFVGVVNAAVWFGAAVCFTLFLSPAASSKAMSDLLGAKNYPFFSVAIGQILESRYFHLYLVCSGVAAVHLMAEWLYFGRYPHRLWLGLMGCLFAFGLAQSCWLQPKLATLHRQQFARPELHESASRSFQVWRNTSQGLNLLVVGGLAFYLWRVANPPDPARFVSPTKFRY